MGAAINLLRNRTQGRLELGGSVPALIDFRFCMQPHVFKLRGSPPAHRLISSGDINGPCFALALLEAGVTMRQINTVFIGNPRRHCEAAARRFAV